MWGVNAAAPLNLVHLGYGLGAIFVNLLVRPFISQNVLPVNVTNNKIIIVPYSITAILCFLIAIGHIFFYIAELRNRRQQTIENNEMDYAAVSINPDNVVISSENENDSPYSPRTCGRGFFRYGLTLSAIFIIYAFCIGGSSQTFSKFFFSYLKFNLSTETASWGMILYWLSFSVCIIVILFRNWLEVFCSNRLAD